MLGLNRDTKRKRGLNFVYVSEVSPNTLQPLTSKSPRHQREHPSFYSWSSLLFWRNFRRQESKRTLLFICLYVCLLVHWRINYWLNATKIQRKDKNEKRKEKNFTRKRMKRKANIIDKNEKRKEKNFTRERMKRKANIIDKNEKRKEIFLMHNV